MLVFTHSDAANEPTSAPSVEKASSDECDNDKLDELDDETIAAGDQHRL